MNIPNPERMSDRAPTPSNDWGAVTLRRDGMPDLVFRGRMIANSESPSSMTTDEHGERRSIRIFAIDAGGFAVASVWAERQDERSIRRSAAICETPAAVLAFLTRAGGISRLARRAMHFAARNDPAGFGAETPEKLPPTVTLLRDRALRNVAFESTRIAGGAFHDGTGAMGQLYQTAAGGYVVQVRGAHGEPPRTTPFPDADALVVAFGHVTALMTKAVQNDPAIAAALRARALVTAK